MTTVEDALVSTLLHHAGFRDDEAELHPEEGRHAVAAERLRDAAQAVPSMDQRALVDMRLHGRVGDDGLLLLGASARDQLDRVGFGDPTLSADDVLVVVAVAVRTDAVNAAEEGL